MLLRSLLSRPRPSASPAPRRIAVKVRRAERAAANLRRTVRRLRARNRPRSFRSDRDADAVATTPMPRVRSLSARRKMARDPSVRKAKRVRRKAAVLPRTVKSQPTLRNSFFSGRKRMLPRVDVLPAVKARKVRDPSVLKAKRMLPKALANLVPRRMARNLPRRNEFSEHFN